MHKYFKSACPVVKCIGVSSASSVFYSYLYCGLTTPEGMPLAGK